MTCTVLCPICGSPATVVRNGNAVPDQAPTWKFAYFACNACMVTVELWWEMQSRKFEASPQPRPLGN